MEHLTKQQIVLLTLLVSFVTSIATGIVAVSLMDQAPVGVTQTINRVVERTIERVVSDSATSSQVAHTAAVNIQDPTAQAVEKVSKNLVRLKSRNKNGETVGFGLILSKDGVIVTDKAVLGTGSATTDLTAVFFDGKEFPIQILQSQILGDIAFVTALAPREYVFSPAIEEDFSSLKLGGTLFALGGKASTILIQGFLAKVPARTEDVIETSVSSANILIGSPLFAVDGNVLGIKTSSLLADNSFYPLSALKPIAPIISR